MTPPPSDAGAPAPAGGELAVRLARLAPEQRARLARALGARAATPAAGSAPRADASRTRYALSLAQERLWFLHRVDPDSSAYNLTTAVGLEGAVDAEAMARAVRVLVRRHDCLRTAIVEDGDGPAQVVAPAAPAELAVVDLARLSEPQRESRVRHVAGALHGTPFRLDAAPLFRIALVIVGKTRHVLVLTMHHVISDLRSFQIFFSELAAVYDTLVRGTASELPPLTVRYGEYAEWQRARLAPEAEAEQLSYWRGRLAAAPTEVAFPGTGTGTARRETGETGGAGQAGFEVGGVLATRLETLGNGHGATLYMTLLTAFGVLLHWYTGQNDLVVATPAMKRERETLQHVIGFFLNTLAVRLDLSGNPSFAGLLERIRDTCLAAFAHSDVPFQRVVAAVQPRSGTPRSSRPNPLADVTFAMGDRGSGEPEVAGIAFTAFEFDHRAERETLVLEMGRTARGLEGVFTFRTEALSPVTVGRLIERFVQLLEAAAASPVLRLDALGAHLDRVDGGWRAQQAQRLKDGRAAGVRSFRRKAL